jgi:hypothetical protein
MLKTKFSPREGARLVEVDARVGLVEYPLPEERKMLSIQRLAGPFVALRASNMGTRETYSWKLTRPFLGKHKKDAQ